MEEILDLLRSTDDNKKFMGLMLVTTLLPAGDQTLLQAVHDAVGGDFLARLILPLSEGPGSATSEEQQDMQTAYASLGLAILCALSMSPALAGSQDFIQHAPLLVKVIRKRSAENILKPGSAAAAGGQSSQDIPDGYAEKSLRDAVNILTCCVRASEEGLQVALQSGAVEAVIDAIQDKNVMADLLTARCTVKLLIALLEEDELKDILHEQGAALFTCVAPLAAMLAKPPQELPLRPQMTSGPAAASAQHSAAQTESTLSGASLPGSVQQNGKSRAAAKTEGTAFNRLEGADEGAGAAPSRFPPGAPSPDDLQTGLQLEVLHVLELTIETPAGDEIQALLAASASPAGWPADMRAGVVAVLRAQTHPWCRQEALAVASAMVAFLGPAWLLGGPPLQGVPGGFYRLVLELASVEVQVLLVDALRGPVPAMPVLRHQNETVQLRAHAMLPMCFRLLDAAVEGFCAMLGDDSSPLMQDGVMERVLVILEEAFQAVLEFLEAALQPSSLGDCFLTLITTQCLGGYLAQHPKAHGERMRALLPRLLALTGGKATKRRGVSTNSAAVQWLTPLMKEAALGPPDALVGARDETQDWLETLRDPGVMALLAAATADLAEETQHNYLMAPPNGDKSMGQLADLCTLLLLTLAPRGDTDGGSPTKKDSQNGGARLERVAAALFARFQRQHRNLSDSGVATTETLRSVVAGGALASVVLAGDGSRTSSHRIAEPALLLAAVDLGFQLSCNLRRPPDIGDGDEAMIALVDEVQDWSSRLLPATAMLAARNENLAEALRSQACVKEMLEASDEELASMLGGSQAGPQPMQALLQALGRPEPVVRRSAYA